MSGKCCRPVSSRVGSERLDAEGRVTAAHLLDPNRELQRERARAFGPGLCESECGCVSECVTSESYASLADREA